jgi:dihydrofolate reductase
LRAGLLDELYLTISPVVLGAGKRLFNEPGDRVPLKLIDSKTFAKGIVHLVYGPTEN